MSASITSSPTLLDHPTFDDFSANHREFRVFDNSTQPPELSAPPSPSSPPPYAEPYIFSYDGDTGSLRLSGFSSSFDGDGQETPRLNSPVPGTPRDRLSSSMHQRPTAGLQLLYTHIAHGAMHDAVVERFAAPTCHPETHRAIVDDVMSWIQYLPPGSADTPPPPTPSSPGSAKPPAYISATMSFYGPHTRSKRSKTASMAPPPSQPEHILWLSGPTGSGKSSLMQTIAERCSNTHTKSHITLVPSSSHYGHVVSDPPVPLLAASFFFRHNRAQRNNKGKFVTTLAWQLAKSVPGLGDIMGRVIERDVGLLSLGEDARGQGPGMEVRNALSVQMERLILEPLAQLVQRIPSSHRYTPITHRVVLIEAVDECISDEDQIEVLNLVRKLSQDGRFAPYFRLVVSSKPHRTIERQFKLHPELDAVTYRLALPFGEGSAGKGRSGGRGRARAQREREAKAAGIVTAGDFTCGDDEVVGSEDVETDIRTYLQCKFNEICRTWYGLPRNVGWPDGPDDPKDSRGGYINRLVYNASGKFTYALTVVRFVNRGEGPDRGSDASDPRRLLHLVMQAKFTKSYQQPYASLDALYNVIIRDAAEKSGYGDTTQLAKTLREIDELLTTSGMGVELTLPRMALFFGFDAEGEGDGKCLERAVTGGLLNPILEVPFPDPVDEFDEELGLPCPAERMRPRFRGGKTLRRVVKFHHRSFTDFIKDPSRAKGMYITRSQLYTDLAVRYLKAASAQYSLQPDGGNVRNKPASATLPSRSGARKGLASPASSSSSFSATYNEVGELDYQEIPISAPSTMTTFRHLSNNETYAILHSRSRSYHRRTASSPYTIDPDEAALFLAELHLGKFCSFSVADAPRLVKELMAFDVELWLFGITAAMEDRNMLGSAIDLGSPPAMRAGPSGRPGGLHRRVMSELPTATNRTSVLAAVPLHSGSELREKEREREKKRSEALLKLHGTPAHGGTSASNAAPGSSGSSVPENDVEAMYQWVHVECSWSSCTPVCKKWRRAIVKFWQRQGAPQQPSVMDRIYDRFVPRDVKRVRLITSRYRL